MTPISIDVRKVVVAEARAWLNTPWRHQGRIKGVGVDCAGLVIEVSRKLSLIPADMDINHYARMPDGYKLLAHCNEWLKQVQSNELQIGDILVMRFDKHPQHIALVADYIHGGFSIIHAADSRDRKQAKVVEHRLTPTLRAKVVASFTLLEASY